MVEFQSKWHATKGSKLSKLYTKSSKYCLVVAMCRPSGVCLPNPKQLDAWLQYPSGYLPFGTKCHDSVRKLSGFDL